MKTWAAVQGFANKHNLGGFKVERWNMSNRGALTSDGEVVASTVKEAAIFLRGMLRLHQQ